MLYQLEVGARIIDDVIAASNGGADRVELYVSPTEGALTPSAGFVKEACLLKKELAFSMQLLAMIRPRAGDMLYTAVEFAVMQSDLEIIIEQGIDGVMFGILEPDGSLDIPRLKKLVQISAGKSMTLHRAFDAVKDPFVALEQAIDLGFEYVLCGGMQQAGCWDRKILPKLYEKAAGRIKMVMAFGPAFKTESLPAYLAENPFTEFHIINGFRQRPSKMEFLPGFEAGSDDFLLRGRKTIEYLEESTVREIREIMDNFEIKDN